MSCLIPFVRALQAVRNGKRVKHAKWNAMLPAGFDTMLCTANESYSSALDRGAIARICLNKLKNFTVPLQPIIMRTRVTTHASHLLWFQGALELTVSQNLHFLYNINITYCCIKNFEWTHQTLINLIHVYILCCLWGHSISKIHLLIECHYSEP